MANSWRIAHALGKSRDARLLAAKMGRAEHVGSLATSHGSLVPCTQTVMARCEYTCMTLHHLCYQNHLFDSTCAQNKQQKPLFGSNLLSQHCIGMCEPE